MSNIKKGFLAFFLLGYNLLTEAQEAIIVTGGNASGTSGTISYTVGQVAYTANTVITGSISQGVQQAFEISVVNTIEQAESIDLICLAYPNPTTNLLKLKVVDSTLKYLIWQLFDLNGKLLVTEKITATETQIPFESLSPATYLLHIVQANKIIKVFKIIKK